MCGVLKFKFHRRQSFTWCDMIQRLKEVRINLSRGRQRRPWNVRTAFHFFQLSVFCLRGQYSDLKLSLKAKYWRNVESQKVRCSFWKRQASVDTAGSWSAIPYQWPRPLNISVDCDKGRKHVPVSWLFNLNLNGNGKSSKSICDLQTITVRDSRPFVNKFPLHR